MVEDILKMIRIDMSRFGAYSAAKSPDVIARKSGHSGRGYYQA